ncbi:MAG TPA: methyltransferase domain-containing protein [Bacillota bacterium]|nr:methyltransferase domain-containing protein [Bacillota bacterium]
MGNEAWKKFFEMHAAVYDDNCFTKDTARECEFLSALMTLPEHRRIIDIGCGTGRHSIRLASMGYEVTGVDLSEQMLSMARKKAEEAGAVIDFRIADAAAPFPKEMGLVGKFDAAICLCEGSLGLIGAGVDPSSQARAIFTNVGDLLRKGGIFVCTVLSAMRPIRSLNKADFESGRFDPVDMVEWHCLSEVLEGLDEETGKLMIGEKSFTGSELKLLLKESGLSCLEIWGGTAGDWGKRLPDPDEYELMAVARKE